MLWSIYRSPESILNYHDVHCVVPIRRVANVNSIKVLLAAGCIEKIA